MFSNINDHELVKVRGMESFPAILSLQNVSDKVFCNTGIYTSILLVSNRQQSLLSSFQIKFQTPNLNALFIFKSILHRSMHSFLEMKLYHAAGIGS